MRRATYEASFRTWRNRTISNTRVGFTRRSASATYRNVQITDSRLPERASMSGRDFRKETRAGLTPQPPEDLPPQFLALPSGGV
jgi:hypothetical protein